MKLLKNTSNLLKHLFTNTDYSWMHLIIIIVVGLLYIAMPQKPPLDWDLNTKGYWSDIPRTYLTNRNLVYPPWGLILLLPYHLLQAAGSRVLSVLTIGWLSYRRKWPLYIFFIIVLSPYFMVTMAKSSMDILVIVLPLLIWEYSKGKRAEISLRGLSLSLMLLKPQCTLLLIPYLIWESRYKLLRILSISAIVLLFTLPISLIGTPPLLIQWLDNIINPSTQNQYYWSINNLSLTAKFGIVTALGIFLMILIFFVFVIKRRYITLDHNQILSFLLLSSMFLLPYTSQQSLSSGLAFIPSWPGLLLQWFGVALGFVTFGFNNNIPIWTLIVGLLTLISYSLIKRIAK